MAGDRQLHDARSRRLGYLADNAEIQSYKYLAADTLTLEPG